MSKKVLYTVPVLVAAVGGFVLGHFHLPAHAEGRRIVKYYVDPMHPAYKSSKPGTAPDCGMDLVPVYEDDASEPAMSTSSAAPSDRLKNYGIRFATVEKTAPAERLSAFGRVVPDDSRVYRVNVGADGFVKETENDALGSRVSKNQILAKVYSPDFLNLAGGYLSASERTQQAGAARETAAGAQGVAGVQNWADRLRNAGMSDLQLKEITTARKIPEDIYVVSPTDGFILSRQISAGQRFEKHMEFYRVADLRKVWVLADVDERDAQFLKPGRPATIVLQTTGKKMPGRVSNALFEVDPTTRNMRVRVEVENSGLQLRPDMLVTVEFPVKVASALTIPADAVLQSGAAKRVYVEEKGHLTAREIETGMRFGDLIQITHGLKQGEQVVASGAFLVDSDARTQGVAQ